MSFSLNPEIASGLSALGDVLDGLEPIPVGDVVSRRAVYDELQRVIHSIPPVPADVETKNFTTTTQDGHELLMRWYSKIDTSPGSAVLYLHGGGMCLSGLEIYDAPVKRNVSATGVPFLSVDYRFAPEFPAPTPVTDSHLALEWLAANAGDLGIETGRIAVMGDSGGGGVAASVAIYARDRGGPRIAKQILVYPMLDDRNTSPDPLLTPFASWTYDDNTTGWTALLGSSAGAAGVSPYAAAARLEDFEGLPHAYIEVGELDIFRAECVAYAQRLMAAGVSTELHVYPGLIHGFDAFAPQAAVTERAMDNRRRAVLSI